MSANQVQGKPGLVNVFIGSYNRAHYLSHAVESVLAQTYSNYHIIIVDDASTDGAANIAKDYEKKYPDRVTAVFKKRNGGLCNSLNIALPLCKEGEFFAFLGDDDIWLPNKLEEQMDSFVGRGPKVGLVCSDAYIIDSEGNLTGQRFSDRHGKYDQYVENVHRKLFLNGNFICGSSALVTYDALASFGFYVPSGVGFTNDYYMWLVISSMFEVQYTEEPLTFYRVSVESVSNRYRAKLDWESYYLHRESYRRFPSIRKLVGEREARDLLVRIAQSYAQESIRTGYYWQYIRFTIEALRLKPSLKMMLVFFSIALRRFISL